MLNPTETHDREKGFFYGAAPPPMAYGSLSVCVCVHACWEEKKNSTVNGDVTVRLWPLHESASEWPYWQLVCVRWVREPVRGLPFPLHADLLRPRLECSRTAVYISSYSHEGGRFISHTHVSNQMCVDSPPWCALSWKPLISPILEIGVKVC